MAEEIGGGELDVPPTTIPGEFLETADELADEVGALARTGEDGDFEEHTWQELADRVRRIGHGLVSSGVEPGDRVAIQSATRLEWMLADLAILGIGAVTTTVYATLSPEEVEFLLDDSGAQVLFVSNQEQFDKVAEVADGLDDLEHVVTFDDADAGDLAKRTRTLERLEAAGKAHRGEFETAYEDRLEEVGHRDPASIVYTSGTTGRPKGCVLSHRNFLAAAASFAEIIEVGPEDTGLAFLPMAHVYQRLTMIYNFRGGARVVFTTPERLAEDLQRFQPDMIASVPRIYEKMYDAVVERVNEEAGGLQRAIFEAASETAREYGRAISNAGSPGTLLSLKHGLFDRLVYEDLRENLGATNLDHAITGAAAIRPDLLYWLRGIGVPILEGYGLTETSAPSNVNRPDRFKPGTVGPPIPGVTQKIRPLEDRDVEGGEDAATPVGEVLMKGPNVFETYFELEEETEEAFTEDGWFKSGDVGYFDEDGFLRIVDRLKQIEVLSTGKNVAPVPIEERLKNSDWIAEAMVIGSDRKFVTALVQPNYARVISLAEEEGIAFDEDAVRREETPSGSEIEAVPEELLAEPAVQEQIEAAVGEANEGLGSYETVKKFRLLPRTLSIDEDELTPTLKKRRRNVRENWADLVDDMYPDE